MTVLTPQMFGSIATDDDTATCFNWVNALVQQAHKEGYAEGHVEIEHPVSRSISRGNWQGKVHIKGIAPTAGFRETAGYNAPTHMLAFSGPTTTGTPIQIKQPAYANTDILSIASTADLAPDTFVVIAVERQVYHPSAVQRGMVNRIADIIDDHQVILTELLDFDIDPEDLDIATIAPIAMNAGDIEIEDLTLRGRNNLALTGIRAYRFIDPIFRNITTAGFQDAGISLDECFGANASSIHDTASGNASTNVGQALRANRLTRATLTDWTSMFSNGMGITLRQLAHCQVVRPKIHACDGRALYIYGSSGCNFINPQSTDARSTGISLVYGSMNNELHSVISHNSGHQGYWSNDRKNRNNVVIGIESLASRIAPDIFIGPSDTGAELYNVHPDSTIIAPTDTPITRMRR